MRSCRELGPRPRGCTRARTDQARNADVNSMALNLGGITDGARARLAIRALAPSLVLGQPQRAQQR